MDLSEVRFDFSVLHSPNEIKREVLAASFLCNKKFLLFGQNKMLNSKGLYPLFHSYGIEVVLILVPAPSFVVNGKVKKLEDHQWYAGNFENTRKNSDPQ